jgi:hypothetical protein
MEILDGKATQFLQMLSALQGVCHPTDGEANATEVEPLILAPADTRDYGGRRDIGRGGSNTSRGPNDQHHLPGCVATLQAYHLIFTGVSMHG